MNNYKWTLHPRYHVKKDYANLKQDNEAQGMDSLNGLIFTYFLQKWTVAAMPEAFFCQQYSLAHLLKQSLPFSFSPKYLLQRLLMFIPKLPMPIQPKPGICIN